MTTTPTPIDSVTLAMPGNHSFRFVLDDSLPPGVLLVARSQETGKILGAVLDGAPPASQAPEQDANDQALEETLEERDNLADVIDKLLDLVLGSDRPEWSNAYGHADALRDVEERLEADRRIVAAARQWGNPKGDSAKACRELLTALGLRTPADRWQIRYRPRSWAPWGAWTEVQGEAVRLAREEIARDGVFACVDLRCLEERRAS